MNSVEKLREALSTANAVALFFKDTVDDGTSNFDHPMLLKPEGMTTKDIEEAFKLAHINFERVKSGTWKNFYHVLGVCFGQGYRRTTMAEKFVEALKQAGYTATVFYQVD